MQNSYTFKNKRAKLLLLLLCSFAILAGPSFSQKYSSQDSQSESRLGFSPDLFTHDFSKSYQEVYGSIRTSLPLNFDSPLNDGIQAKLNNHPLFSEGSVSNQGALNSSISAGIPLYDGSISLNYVENFQNSYMIENPGSILDVDSTISNGNVKLRANLSSSMLFEQSWKTVSGGYSLHLDKHRYLAFQLHKHLFSFRLNGDMKGSWRGNLTRNDNGYESQFPIEYNEDRFYTSLKSEYSGSSWSPEISFSWDKWSWRSLLSTRTKLSGSFSFLQSSPYFTDPLTLEMNIPVDSLLNNYSVESSIAGTFNQYQVESQDVEVYWVTPEVHTLGYALIPDKLNLSLTWFRNKFGVSMNHADSLKQFLDPAKWSFQPDYVLSTSFDFKPFRGQASWLVFDSKQSDPFFQEIELLSLSRWLDKGHIPYLTTGVELGELIKVSIDLQTLPVQALNIGVRYVY